MFQKAMISKHTNLRFVSLVGFLFLVTILFLLIPQARAEVKYVTDSFVRTTFDSELMQLDNSTSASGTNARRLLSEGSTDPAAYMQASLEEYRDGNVAKALSILEKGRKMADESEYLLVGLSVLYVECNSLANAEEAASAALELNPACVAAHIQLGEVFSCIGWHESAISSFSDALSFDAGNGRAWFRLGCCLRAANRLDDASNAFLSATQLLTPPTEAWMELGKLRLTTGQFSEAARIFGRILEDTPLDPSAQASLVLAYALSGEGRTGEQKAKEFIKAGTDTPEIWLALGESLEQQTNLRDAFGCYGHALALDPDSASAHSRRGRLFYRFGQYPQSETECLSALKIDPDDALAHACLGLVLVQLDRPDEARDHAQIAESAGLSMAPVWDTIGH